MNRGTRERRTMKRTATSTTRNPHVSADVREKGGHGAKSEAVRERAIVALLSEKTVTDAAAKAGVNEKTLRRWLSEDEAFQAEYAAARQAAFDAGIHRVQALTARAVDTLAELLDDTDHPNVRLGAARTVTEIAIHQHDAATILMRLDELDAAQQRSHQGKTSC